ncbi:signal peptidase I [soil metagenome]
MPGYDSFDTDLQTNRHASTDADARPRIHPIQPGDTDPFAPAGEDDVEDTRKKDQERPSFIWEITETLVLALLIFVAVRSVVLNFRVDGLSMEPSLDTGQMLLVNRQMYFNFDANDVLNIVPFVEREGENVFYLLHPPQRGDIVVFSPPVGNASKPYIKRIIGLPGETITIHDGGVYVDGARLDEPYLQGTSTSWPNGDPNREVVVPEDHLFVLGDNRNNSTDSRSFGAISNDSLIGKAWISYWPSTVAGILGTPDYEQ